MKIAGCVVAIGPYHPRMQFRLLTLGVLVATSLHAAEPRRLPTGLALDPAAPTHRVGNFPLTMINTPEGDRLALLLCGWREQGVQIVDRDSGAVLQNLPQPAAFIGLAFSHHGKTLFASGGNDDNIHVYRWTDRAATKSGVIALRHKPDPKKSGTSYPAGIAVSPDDRFLYVAENLGDTLAVVDIAAGRVVKRLSTDRYPYAVAADAKNVYVSCWGSNSVIKFAGSGEALTRRARIVVGRHPSSMLLHRTRLYVTSAQSDAMSVVDTTRSKQIATLHDRAPAGPSEGCTPNALELSADGRRLFVAEADANSVAVFDLGSRKLIGRVPTEWYPAALARSGNDIVVANAKGAGSGPDPQRVQPDRRIPAGTRDYTLGQIDGSVMTFAASASEAQLASWTKRVAAANGWTRTRTKPSYPPFKHVIYVIKENRTYDQIFGDMPIGDGDPSLNYFNQSITPNHRALAERFGLYDRFFVNAEVSAQGHDWSTAAYSGDYVEKTTPSEYSGRGRTYDYEGSNRGQIVDDEDDVNAPSTGYLWDAALKRGLWLRDYGEYVVRGDEVGRGKTLLPTKRAIAKTANLNYEPFNMDVSDQKRADVWIREFERYVHEGKMPDLEIVRLPNDHTAGTAPGKPTPRAFMADNDLALGRMVEAVSRSPFWRDTVFFVLEDDAQSGPDHVDSHRSVLIVISPYNRSGVVHRFVNTTDVLATIEEILGLETLSQFDHYGRPLRDVFAAEADVRPFAAITPKQSLEEKNPPNEAAAKQSAKLDFSRPDAVDDELLNLILWRAIKGEGVPYPGATRAPSIVFERR
jgi:DNA-binding beta-propeller fold protein YncE